MHRVRVCSVVPIIMDNPSVLDYPRYLKMLGPQLLQPVLESLDLKLGSKDEYREFIVCLWRWSFAHP